MAPQPAEPHQSRTRRLAANLARNDRFLTPRMLASLGVYLLVAASYLQARITDDGVIYYNFMRRLVGEDVPAYAYQFGVVFWNLPFFMCSRGSSASQTTTTGSTTFSSVQ